MLWPDIRSWQEPVVREGDEVVRTQLLATGITHVYFQANVWIFTGFVFIIGIAMGIGKAAVYKYTPALLPQRCRCGGRDRGRSRGARRVRLPHHLRVSSRLTRTLDDDLDVPVSGNGRLSHLVERGGEQNVEAHLGMMLPPTPTSSMLRE